MEVGLELHEYFKEDICCMKSEQILAEGSKHLRRSIVMANTGMCHPYQKCRFYKSCREIIPLVHDCGANIFNLNKNGKIGNLSIIKFALVYSAYLFIIFFSWSYQGQISMS